jgi:hypothetical protein
VPLSLVFSAVVVEGRKSGECRCLFAADPSEFRHANDECQRSALADAGNAEDEVEALGEIVMIAQGLGDTRQLGDAARLQPLDVGQHNPPEPGVVNMLEAYLEPGNILFGLLNEGQVAGQLRQALV